MINIKGASNFCREDITKIENYEQAANDKKETWHCHHKKEIEENKPRTQLIDEGLYYNRPANELIFLTNSEHSKLHYIYREHNKKESFIYYWKDKQRSEETKSKIQKTLSEQRLGENNPMYGKHLNDEQKLNHSISAKEYYKEHPEALLNPKRSHKGQHRVYDNPEHTKYHYE